MLFSQLFHNNFPPCTDYCLFSGRCYEFIDELYFDYYNDNLNSVDETSNNIVDTPSFITASLGNGNGYDWLSIYSWLYPSYASILYTDARPVRFLPSSLPRVSFHQKCPLSVFSCPFFFFFSLFSFVYLPFFDPWLADWLIDCAGTC